MTNDISITFFKKYSIPFIINNEVKNNMSILDINDIDKIKNLSKI